MSCAKRTNCTGLNGERPRANATSATEFVPRTQIGVKAIHLEFWLRNVSLSLRSQCFEITKMSAVIRVHFNFVINYGRKNNQYGTNGYEYDGYGNAQRVLFSFINASTLLRCCNKHGGIEKKCNYSFLCKVQVVMFYLEGEILY